MESLTGKNTLVKGAGKGIGSAVAIALAKEGVNVALLARTTSDLKVVAAELEKEGVKAVIVTADVSDLESVTTAVEQATASLGSIEVMQPKDLLNYYSSAKA
jgi:3-oxoacyl-[acyl-carrier protein] reductase